MQIKSMQHKTLGRRLFEDVSVVRQDLLITQNANVVDLEDRRHAVDCQSDMLVRDPSDTETRVLPAWTIFALVHEANANGEVEAWSGHTDSHWTLIVLLNSSPTVTGIAGTTGDQPMLHSQSPASIIPKQPRWTGRRSESAKDGYFSVVSVWKKQFDTVRATWEHMLTSETK